ncbi:hypothetical protein HCN44_000216 [Aphidius gifuensis]|uniref:Uncharacterized protein n=1 Tax=Aphidius gifuensis TaxID=684658 RepID=A0A834XQM2_APHGI|nr:hypothetical protein HCN44_000216 [Aphidius gifuensis]
MIKDYYNYWKRHVYSRKSNAYKQSPAVSVPDAFTSCLLDGNVEGFKFFFNELSTNDKRAIVVPTAEVILVKYVEAINHKQSSIMYIATDVKQRIDMLIFLYINMPVSEKSNFICRNKMVLLDIFIKEWPWSNSYAEILDLNPLTTLEYGRLIVSIMNVVIDEFNQLGKKKEMNELKKKIKNDPQVKIHLKKYYLKCPYLYITLLDSCSFTPEEIDEMQVKIASESETPKTKKTPKTYIKIIRK